MRTSSSAALEHLAHRREPVAVEAGAVADPQRDALSHEAPVPRPAGPAKAWAMSSHRSASAPTATRSVSARWTRWVTSRQKSYGRAGDPLGGVRRAPRPQVAGGRGQLDPELLGRRGSGRARRRRSRGCARRGGRRAGSGRCRSAVTPSASCTSRPCAQVSMNRAVAIEVADIGGPNHGIFVAVGVGPQRGGQRRRARRASGPAARPAGTAPPARAAVSTTPSGSAMAVEHQRVPGRLVGGRGAARPRRSRPGARPGWRRPSRRRGWACATGPRSSPATSASRRSPSAREVGRARHRARRSRGPLPGSAGRGSRRASRPSGPGSGRGAGCRR